MVSARYILTLVSSGGTTHSDINPVAAKEARRATMLQSMPVNHDHVVGAGRVVGARDESVRTRPNGPRMQAEGKKAKPSQWARAKFDGRLARALQSLANCC
jgi:hypothetical protein